MKRDMELVRQIAFAVEATTTPLQSTLIKIDEYSKEQIEYHCNIMKEAGLINADELACRDAQYSELIIYRLTWTGHDFLDAAKDNTIWNKVMTEIKGRVTSMTFDGIVKLLNASAQNLVTQGIEWVSQ